MAAAVGSSGYVDSFLNTDMSYGDASSPGDMNNSAGSPDPDKPDKDDDEKESGNTPPQTVSFRNTGALRSSKVDETSWIIVRSNLIRTLATPFRYHSVLRYGRI